MLPFLAQNFLTRLWGPFRLLESRMVLIFLGAAGCTLLTWLLLPRLWDRLPHDRGKALVKEGALSRGKPTGAGLVLVLFTLLCAEMVMPLYAEYHLINATLLAIMATGYLDDRSTKEWGQLKKGLLDYAIALAATAVLAHWQGTAVWFPFVKGTLPGGAFALPLWVYIPLGSAFLWLMINVVNCSDGVDGVAGSLLLYGLGVMGVLLYACLGHETVANYLLVPHIVNGASWATLLFTAAGGLAAYLWYNASPSQVLMGDAGSRFYGLLMGIAVLVTGNPFLFLVAAPILFINGGAGLVKLTLLRCLKKLGWDTRPPLANFPQAIHPENFATPEEEQRQHALVRLLHHYRLPFHDHCRRRLGWSDSQVLIRFMLLQTLLMPLVAILIFKLR